MPEITARDLLGPVSLGLTVEDLLGELENAFPPSLPTPMQTQSAIMYQSGQRSVVEWIINRINEE
jgi:hypothetical protein